MKLLFILLLTFISVLNAEKEFGGEFKFSKAWYVYSNKWKNAKDTYHLFDLHLKNQIDNIDYKGRVQIRFWDSYKEKEIDGLQNMGNVLSYEIIPWEVWVRINNIPVERMSLQIGKQYFEWGTADGIHPTSVLNPDDYTDPFALNEKIPVNAFNLNYYISSFKIFLIWIPGFTSVKMPGFFNFYNTDEYNLPGTELVNINEKYKRPSGLADGMGKAVKVCFSLFHIDFSCGYFSGYDYMPVAEKYEYFLTGNMVNQLGLLISSIYPKMRVYTFDLTTSIEGFGFWSEAGVYDYFKKDTLIITPQGLSRREVFNGEPYVSYVFGTDYSFINGFYINLQYAYGLPYVRGKELLEDYIVFAFKDEFANGLFGIEIGNMLGFKRNLPVKNNYEIIITPELKSYYFDDVVIGLMFSIVDAKGDVLFKDWQKYNSLKFYVSCIF